MYNFHVGVKVCLRLGVVPNSTPIVEVKSKERSGSWSYRGRVQGNSMGSYQSHNHLSVLQELNIKHNLHYREKSKIWANNFCIKLPLCTHSIFPRMQENKGRKFTLYRG